MSELALKLIEENKELYKTNPEKAKFLDLGECGLVNYLPELLFSCIWLEELNLGSFFFDVNGLRKRTINGGFDNYFKNYDLEKLSKLVDLKSLYLSYTSIEDFSFLQKIRKLSFLDIRANKINSYDFLFSLSNLKKLDISFNKFSDFSFLENINSLDYLDLCENSISDINFLKNLTNLKSLNLSTNSLIDCSPIKFLKELEVLDLSYNKIQDLNFLQHLFNLKSFKIRENNVAKINPLKELLKLEILDLEKNNITDIGPIEKLVNLKSVNLNDNRIGDITALLPLIKNGLGIKRSDLNHQIKIDYNPIFNPPKEIFDRGRDVVLRYLEKIENEGIDYIFESKLTLVGDGGAGKTSLQRRIIDEKSQLPSGDDRTRGIKVYDWSFSDSNSQVYTSHIWDFGGQDVYYPVHRFFLTENSVYILMASTRFTNHNFEYWIPTIYQFGGKSPIILVQNCDNGNQKNWEDLNIFYSNSEYNLSKPYYPINLIDNNRGLKSLKGFIQQQIFNLPHIGKPVPKSWVKVRASILELSDKKPYISFYEFKELCRKADAQSFQKDLDIDDLGHFFHDLGIILWYYKKNQLRDLVILKPEWAMNAVYKIIDDIRIQENFGIISQFDFERIWSEDSFKAKIIELKLMLQVFKIAFPKKHKKSDFILPARLLPIADDDKWNNNEKFLRLEYSFDLMPRGILNQVCAELSNFILSDESVWNNAVILKNHDGVAQIVEDYFNRKINVKSKGRDARGIMLMIMNAVSEIVKEYKGVKPSIYVPCNCLKCETLDKPTKFEYDELLELIKEERISVTCNKSDIKLNINELLYSVGFQSSKENDELTKIKETTKKISPEIFFSYAWDKEGDGESREQIVKDLYESLAADGLKVVLDKEDLRYKESITDFMVKRIGKGNIIVVALSDAYLKSINCMYEFYEIYINSKHNRESMLQRIFPIRVETISLNKPSVLETYFDFWENLETEWATLISNKAKRIGAYQQAKYKKVQAIASELGDFLDFLSDINSKSKEELSKDNFSEIKAAIKKRLEE